MDSARITIKTDNGEQELVISYLIEPPTLVTSINETQSIIEGANIFECFAKLRMMHPKIRFLCKGSKINVHPSRMSSQMSSGLMAYELTLGRQALRENLVNIFEHENENLTNDYQEQQQFFKKWINSLRSLQPPQQAE